MPISVPPYMPIAPRDRPNIDIAGSISGLGDALQQGLEYGQKRRVDRATRAAFAGGIPTGPDGMPDYMAAAGQILQGGGDMDTAMTLARLAEAQNERNWQHNRPDWQTVDGSLYNLNDLGGQRGGQQAGPQAGAGQPSQPDYGQPDYAPEEPEQQADSGGPEPVIRGKPEKKRPIVINDTAYDPDTMEPIVTAPPEIKPLGASDRKAIRTAGEQNVQLKSTVAALNRALELNDKIFTGAGAEGRQWLGTQLPDALVPDVVADPRQAQQTEEWRSLMKPEAIAAMANSLSGATTDFELRQFVELMADPKTTAKTRSALITRMLKLAEERQAFNEEVIQEYQGADLEAGSADAAPEQQGEIIETGDGRFRLMPDGTVVQLD